MIRIPKKIVRRGVRRHDRGQRPTATVDPDTKPPRRRQSRHCSRVRRPRFPHLAARPHPSRHGSETAFTQPVTCQKDVRRRHRGQRPTATKDPNTRPPRRRQSRHCSRVRRPQFPHLAARPHPSRHGSETAFTQPGGGPIYRNNRHRVHQDIPLRPRIRNCL